jgi:glycosyltransferase involved in cell wall biosynthesis
VTRPIRFCLLTTFYPPWNFGGDGIQVQRLAHALADRGHPVTIVCAPKVHRILSHERVSGPAPHSGVEIVPLPDGPASLAGTYLTGRPLRSRRRLERLLGRGFDVLHFHNPSLLGAPALLGMGSGLKLYTAHEQWLLCPSHVLWKRGGRVCEDPPCRSCEIAHLRPPQPWRHSSLLGRSLTNLDALILPSRTSARLHERFEPLVRIEVIKHFVPDSLAGGTPRPEGREAAVAPGRPYFLYCGRLEPIKGVGTLIEAWRRGRSEDLVIAGDGGLKRRLRRAAADLPQVHFTGQLSPAELTPLYRGAIAVVMPTLGHEVLPLVALEAFTTATPAIVRRFGALAELVDETRAGIAYGSPEELDAALDLLATDEDLRRELGGRAAAAFAEHFSVGAHMGRYFSLIASLARARGDRELASAAVAAMPTSGTDPVRVEQ